MVPKARYGCIDFIGELSYDVRCTLKKIINGTFQITSGTGGAPCPPAPLPFSPNMIAGSTTDQNGT